VLTKLAACMGNVSDFTAITEGEESQAYRFLSGSRPYVARVNRDVKGFEKDAFAHRRFARPNLPIPAVIHVGQIEHAFFCISEAMPGVTLQDLVPEDLPRLLEPTARVWEAIAESDLGAMRGFGPFDASGHAAYGSWRDFLISIADEQRYDWRAVGHLVPRDEISRLLERLLELVEECPEERALVHGDFGSNNVLTDRQRITGVIDWSEASIGDPLYDVANVFFWRTWLECMRQQASYFEMKLGGLAELGGPLLCYQLRIGLAEIYQTVTENKTASAYWALARCGELVRR
jgi:hygromycin-B 4-O-kinase